MPNYNNIAWIYNLLVKLVYGNKLERANSEFIGKIPDKSRVLIVGGGTGNIIKSLDNLNKSLDVDYVEISSKMIVLSKRKSTRNLTLTFYNKSILDFAGNGYDVIITNFFFDQFPLSIGQEIANHLYPKLKIDGFLIYCDFVPTNHLIDRFIITISYWFLSITANLATNRLPEFNDLFYNTNFKQKDFTQTSRNIIASLIYP